MSMIFRGLPVLLLPWALTGCGHTTMVCEPPTPVPEQLTRDLLPLVEAPSDDSLAILEAHLENMRRAGMCFASYEALVEAVEARDGRFE